MAQAAASFLDTLPERMPFPVRANQVDGGSEFKPQFEVACQQRGLQLFVLPPRSPKLNGHVERAQRTHREEFYEVADLSWTVSVSRPQLLAWEKVYNTVRPLRVWGIGRPWRSSVGLSAGRRGIVTNVLDEYTGLTPHEPAC